MFTGYSFFDYKYNIPNYEGYDYYHFGRYLYLIISVVALVTLLIIFRNAKKETILKYLKISGIVFCAMYVIKTTWESIYDITVGPYHEFNLNIMPFDTCSIVMWASLMAGFGKGKIKKLGECWLVTGNLVGGISTMLFINALKFYPFFTFGAFYSMLWHFFMVFGGIWMIVTNYVKMEFKTVLYGFALHTAISVIVIPLDYMLGLDFMLYMNAGGVPLIESLADKFNEHGLYFLTNIVMLAAYFALFAGIVYFSLGVKKLIGLIKDLIDKHKKPQEPAAT